MRLRPAMRRHSDGTYLGEALDDRLPDAARDEDPFDELAHAAAATVPAANVVHRREHLGGSVRGRAREADGAERAQILEVVADESDISWPDREPDAA